MADNGGARLGERLHAAGGTTHELRMMRIVIKQIRERASTPIEWDPSLVAIADSLQKMIDDADERRRAIEENEDNILSLYGPGDDIPGAAA